jgi:hypothetical protein
LSNKFLEGGRKAGLHEHPANFTGGAMWQPFTVWCLLVATNAQTYYPEITVTSCDFTPCLLQLGISADEAYVDPGGWLIFLSSHQ